MIRTCPGVLFDVRDFRDRGTYAQLRLSELKLSSNRPKAHSEDFVSACRTYLDLMIFRSYRPYLDHRICPSIPAPIWHHLHHKSHCLFLHLHSRIKNLF